MSTDSKLKRFKNFSLFLLIQPVVNILQNLKNVLVSTTQRDEDNFGTFSSDDDCSDSADFIKQQRPLYEMFFICLLWKTEGRSELESVWMCLSL